MKQINKFQANVGLYSNKSNDEIHKSFTVGNSISIENSDVPQIHYVIVDGSESVSEMSANVCANIIVTKETSSPYQSTLHKSESPL